MSDMKKKYLDFDKIVPAVILALLTAGGMCYCFWKSGIFPFGDNSNLFSDLATQYVNFLVFFRNSSPAEKIFSLTKGLGGQTFGLLSYYTFSPFNLIVFLFSPENIETALFAIFIARAVFMAENMYCYLSHHFENAFYNIAVAMMYTFYPFFTRYYFNILWFDCFALLPLLILGTEKIMAGKSGKLFVFAYVYSLISNYYIAYMSSLFVLCWFVYRFVMDYGFDFMLAVKKTVKMAYYTVVSVMLSAPVLLPSFFLLAQGKFADDTISSWRVVKPYNILTLPVSLFEGGMVFEYTPHFVGSIVCVFLLAAYLLNKKIDKREKVITVIFYAFIAMGFAFRILGYIWHGFSAPQGFHNRQTFAYAFLMLVICRKSLEHIDYSTGRKVVVTMAGVYALALLYLKLFPAISVGTEKLVMTAVTATVVSVCMLLMKKFPSVTKNALGLYMCFMAVYMGGWFMAGQYNGDKPYTMAPAAAEFKDNYISVKSLMEKIDDNGFYRIEDPTRWSQNQAMSHGYNSVSHYSSVFETRQKEMFMYYGFDDTYYSTTYNRSLPLNDFVFGVKYVMSSDAALVTDHYEALITGEKNVYYNPFWIPVVYTGKTNDIRFSDYWVDTVNNMTVALTGMNIYRADGNADYSKLETIAEIIRENECEVIKNDGMFLSFSTGKTDNEYLLSSLMYDENWHIKVNGKATDPQQYMKYFLAVPIDAGMENIVEMTYVPKGMTEGVAVMSLAIAAVAVVSVTKAIKNSKNKKSLQGE